MPKIKRVLIVGAGDCVRSGATDSLSSEDASLKGCWRSSTQRPKDWLPLAIST